MTKDKLIQEVMGGLLSFRFEKIDHIQKEYLIRLLEELIICVKGVK